MDFDTCLVCQVLQFEFLGLTSPDIGVSLLTRISSFWSHLVVLADGGKLKTKASKESVMRSDNAACTCWTDRPLLAAGR